MADLLREIDEELQRERMAALWHKYKYAIVTAATLLVLATASWTAWREHNLRQQYKRSAGFYAVASDAGKDGVAKAEALAGFAREFPGTGHAALAQFAAAREYLQAKKPAAAVALFDMLAKDETLSGPVRQYAELLSAQTQFDIAINDALQGQLERLAADGQPWRYTARALLGLYHGRKGARDKARMVYAGLADDENAPAALREQARDLARYYAIQDKKS